MSDSMIVFIRNEHIPKIDQLREALQVKGLTLESWDEASSIQEVEGFWPGRFKGEEAGFEFMLGEVEDDDLEDWGVKKSSLEGRELVIDLAYYTELDLSASAICAAYFIDLCDGVTFGDEDELSVNRSNADEWLKNYL